MTKTESWLIVCLGTLLVLASPPSMAGDESADTAADLEEVLERLEDRVSGIQTLKADFEQQKFLAVLDQPLVLRGTIFMEKPDLFSWIVREPLRYSMVIEGDVMRQWDEDTQRTEKISLTKNPVFKMAIQQLRDWLSGAYKSMLGQYEIAVLGENPISLEFVPRDTALAHEVIDRVTVEFDRDGRYIRRIHILEKQGDRTVISFANTLLNAPIAPTAWKVEQDVQ